MPSRALNAGSTWPPLAARTALTTDASIEGKASFRVVSACSRGFIGRGGFGGGASSFGGGLGALAGFDGTDALVSASWSLSRKSRGLAVVGDSPPSEGLRGETGDKNSGQFQCWADCGIFLQVCLNPPFRLQYFDMPES